MTDSKDLSENLHKNRVRQFRTSMGLSQGGLAEKAGVTRQTVSALENERYSPNVNVASRLARALGCSTDDLFPLPDDEDEYDVDIIGTPDALAQRVSLANVRGRLLAYPLSSTHAIQEGFTGADGVIPRSAIQSRARLLVPSDQLEQTALLVGCDPAVGILSSHVARRNTKVRLTWLFASSRAATEAVEKGQAHIAGSHLSSRGKESNVDEAHRVLNKTGGVVVALAGWEQGFLVPKGNPKHILVIDDLARPDVQMINREQGAGCRELLDSKLSEAGIAPRDVNGYERIASSHIAVARSVASGGADVGVALRATAQACGLDFVPLDDVRFDLIIPRDLLSHPAVSATLEVMQSRTLRNELEALPGYDLSEMGNVIAEIPSSS